jgi:hypothetical protein
MAYADQQGCCGPCSAECGRRGWAVLDLSVEGRADVEGVSAVLDDE